MAAGAGARDLAAVQAYLAAAQSSEFAIGEQVRPVTCRFSVLALGKNLHCYIDRDWVMATATLLLLRAVNA